MTIQEIKLSNEFLETNPLTKNLKGAGRKKGSKRVEVYAIDSYKTIRLSELVYLKLKRLKKDNSFNSYLSDIIKDR